MQKAPSSSASHAIRRIARDFGICLQFYSRLPVRLASWTMADLPAALRLAPLAGAVIGSVGAVVLLVGGGVLALPAWLAATLAAAVLVMVTGALHEDGLADIADGFGGGSNAERKLEIMKDSRIGSFGTLALILSVVARIGAIAAIARLNGYTVASVVLVAAEASSRGFGLVPLAALPPARTVGLGRAAGRLPSNVITTALILAAAACLLPIASGMAPWRPTLAGACALAAAFGTTWLAKRQIGGQTGDVAGAAQQLCEIAYLIGLLIAPEDT